MSEHKHGEMDIEDHQKTFEGFIRAAAWSGVAAFAILIFIALVNG